jgi:hypothetical protein
MDFVVHQQHFKKNRKGRFCFLTHNLIITKVITFFM